MKRYRSTLPGAFGYYAKRSYFFDAGFQLRTTVIGKALSLSLGTLIKNRWPSGETAYCCRFGPLISRMRVANNSVGGEALNVCPSGVVSIETDINLPSAAT